LWRQQSRRVGDPTFGTPAEGMQRLLVKLELGGRQGLELLPLLCFEHLDLTLDAPPDRLQLIDRALLGILRKRGHPLPQPSESTPHTFSPSVAFLV